MSLPEPHWQPRFAGERARFNPKVVSLSSARSVLGAMAKTRLMFVNEAELGLGAGECRAVRPLLP